MKSKTLKCPECNKVSTFTARYDRTITYETNLIFDKAADELVINYDDEEMEDGQDHSDTLVITCDKCSSQVCLDGVIDGQLVSQE